MASQTGQSHGDPYVEASLFLLVVQAAFTGPNWASQGQDSARDTAKKSYPRTLALKHSKGGIGGVSLWLLFGIAIASARMEVPS